GLFHGFTRTPSRSTHKEERTLRRKDCRDFSRQGAKNAKGRRLIEGFFVKFWFYSAFASLASLRDPLELGVFA
ncbi:MAG: hypothetical protein KDC71_18085, partial [Acidobacteria bacterium]|nr:hypothetical protein [Acidobacteriota bacterium]